MRVFDNIFDIFDLCVFVFIYIVLLIFFGILFVNFNLVNFWWLSKVDNLIRGYLLLIFILCFLIFKWFNFFFKWIIIFFMFWLDIRRFELWLIIVYFVLYCFINCNVFLIFVICFGIIKIFVGLFIFIVV